MRNIVVVVVFVLYLCQIATAYSCFRDPYMLPTTPCTNMCASSRSSSRCSSRSSSRSNSYDNSDSNSHDNSDSDSDDNSDSNSGSNSCSNSRDNSCSNNAKTCNCSGPCKCFRNADNVCKVSGQPFSVCQCLAKCDCDGPNYPIYFPEVVYPVPIMEIEPFIYRNCFSA